MKLDPSFSPAGSAGAAFPTGMLPCSAAGICPSEQTVDVGGFWAEFVGAGLREPITAELDRAIAELSACIERAYKDGDRVGAAIYLERRDAAIRSSTPEHQAAIEAAINADPCYFSAMGEIDSGRYDVTAQAVRRRTGRERGLA